MTLWRPTDRARGAALGQVTAAPTVVRRGSAADAELLVAMHGRCSVETVYRRYHAPMPHLALRLARTLMQPARGWSVAMTSGEELVGVAVLARDDGENDVGLLVEDRWQRRGAGTRLFRAVAGRAADEGATTLHCVAQPDNPAVLATIRRAGLKAHVTLADGLLHITVPVAGLAETPAGSSPGAPRPRRPRERSP
jgi:GNAT superfamily N-acetyltransferase